MPTPLTTDKIQQALDNLPGWSHRDNALEKLFEFSDFPEAMSFMVRVGFAAEARQHHPQFINIYNKVTVSLSTHDADGKVTQKDVELAEKIESINWIPEK